MSPIRQPGRPWPIPGILFACLPLVLAAQDIVVLPNGVRLEGRIVSLERGVLRFDADYTKNTLEIDWDDTARIESKGRVAIELAGGRRLSGTLATAPEGPEWIAIRSDDGPLTARRADLISMNGIAGDFRGRFDAGVDFGLSQTKADNLRQISVGGDFDYEADKWQARGTLHVLHSTQGAASLRRIDATGSIGRFLGGPWFSLAAYNFLTSQEQHLDLRTTLFGGIGRSFRRTNRKDISTLAGAGWTNENFSTAGRPKANSVEAVSLTTINFYDAFNNNLDFLNTLTLFPSLSETGRIRLRFSSELRWEMPRKLFFSVRFLDSYDTSPRNNTAKNDYVITTGLGWKL